jgi:hypothetical protein
VEIAGEGPWRHRRLGWPATSPGGGRRRCRRAAPRSPGMSSRRVARPGGTGPRTCCGPRPSAVEHIVGPAYRLRRHAALGRALISESGSATRTTPGPGRPVMTCAFPRAGASCRRAGLRQTSPSSRRGLAEIEGSIGVDVQPKIYRAHVPRRPGRIGIADQFALTPGKWPSPAGLPGASHGKLVERPDDNHQSA